MPLSDLSVRTMKPREKAYKVYDRDGLFLLVKSGRIKTVALALLFRSEGKTYGVWRVPRYQPCPGP
jgi:hypothetical protein